MDNNQNNYNYNGDTNSSSTIKLDKSGYAQPTEQNTGYANSYNNPYSTQNNYYNNGTQNPYTQNNQYNTQNTYTQNNPYNAYNAGNTYNTQAGPRLLGLAIASMGCGIFGIMLNFCYGFGILFAIAALILRAQYRKNNNNTDNKFSKAGFITGLIGIIIGALIVAFVVFAIAMSILAESASYY